MRILLVEDEASTARRTARLATDILGTVLVELKAVDEIDHAFDYLASNQADLILLDLNLNGQNGFDLLAHFTALAADTIVISAYHDKALEAFEYGVLDFVPKPVRRERFELALKRYLGTEQRSSPQTTRLTIRKHGKLKSIDLAVLQYIKGADAYTELHLRDGSRELSDKSLESLQRILPDRFVRIHRSYIVDVDDREELLIQSGGRYQLRLGDDTVLPVGRSYYREIKSTYFPH